MKNHLYLLAVLAMILSMVIFGCAASAPSGAPEEPIAEGSVGPLDTSAEASPEKEPEPDGPREYHIFQEEGVAILAPSEYSVEQTELGDIQDAPGPPDAEYFRPVFSFNLLRDGEKVTGGAVPPIDIWVRWTPEDARPPEEGTTPPRLAILWKKDDGWQYADEEYPVVYCPPDFPALGGVAHLVIEEWQPGDDPGIGWAD